MYTKSVIDRLTEKLAEELSPEQLEELTRLCEGVYDPAVFEVPEDSWERPAACGAWYAKENGCVGGSQFNDAVTCVESGKFDFGKCAAEEEIANRYTASVLPGVITTHKNCTESNPFTCNVGNTYACAKSNSNAFSCPSDDAFICQANFVCYGEYSSPDDSECPNSFACADPHDCQSGFTCKTSHTCGEGELGLEVFICDTGSSEFDCGEGTGEQQSGEFTCRDTHTCTNKFTCHSHNECGTLSSPDITYFTCGSELSPNPQFDCLTIHDCVDQFKCTNIHVCGNPANGDNDTFTCGNGPGDVDVFECGHEFDCLDIFKCRDQFDCYDVFACGDNAEQRDEFSCGTGDPWDRFTCGTGQTTDRFTCISEVPYGCQAAEPSESSFACSSQAVTEFNCDNFVCHEHGGQPGFTCPNAFNCRITFDCGDVQSANTFECGGDESTDRFTCGSTEGDGAISAEFTCWSKARFTCVDAPEDRFNCPAIVPTGFDCSEKYSCTARLHYCRSPYVCDNERLWNCSENSVYTCEPPITCSLGFSCNGLFVCQGLDQGAPFECRNSYTCTVSGFRCQGGFICENHGCTGHFRCSDEGWFYCRLGVTCSESTNFECVHAFGCVNDVFSCEQGYICNAGAFLCSGQNATGGNQRFHCAEGAGGGFDCTAPAKDFICGGGVDPHPSQFWCQEQGPGVDGFVCSTEHLFDCGATGRDTFHCSYFTCRPQGVCNPDQPYYCGGNPVYGAPGDFSCSHEHICHAEVRCGAEGTPAIANDFVCGRGGLGSFDCLPQGGSFTCNTPSACFTDDMTGHYCPSGGFSCGGLTEEVKCEGDSTFSCPADYSCVLRFNCGVGDQNCTGNIFTCRIPAGYTCGSTGSVPFSVPPPDGGQAFVSGSSGRSGSQQVNNGFRTVTDLIQLVQQRSQIIHMEAHTLVVGLIAKLRGQAGPVDIEARLESLGLDIEVLMTKLGYKGMLT